MSENKELTRFIELLRFHDENARYGKKALQVTAEIQFAEKRLRKLAERWAAAKHCDAKNDKQQAENETCNEVGIVQADGSRLIEADESFEMALLIGNLKILCGELPLTVEWLQTVNSTMREGSMSIHNLVATGEVPDECYLMMGMAGAAYNDFQTATRSLMKATSLLLSLDVSPSILRSDIAGPKFLPKLLEVASEMMEQAAIASRQATSRLHFSEGRWKELQEKLKS